jgi:dihydroorotate dehydrogenase
MDERWSELGLTLPWMNAAGFMGYLPQQIEDEPFHLGAFVTNPVSLLPRSPAHHRNILAYPGGFLLHNGHPNPGLKSVLKIYAHKWQKLPMPVWIHLLVTTPFECEQMVREVEGLENVTAIELGLPPGLGLKKQLELVQSGIGELPIMVSLPLDEINLTLIDHLSAMGEIGVVLSAPRGVFSQNGRTTSGRLFGPALHPQLLAAMCRLRGLDLPIIAGCGIFSREQGEAALAVGATAVQVDGWCWQF